MIAIPWVVFIVGCVWMIWRGVESKREYLRRKSRVQQEADAAAWEDHLIEELGRHPYAKQEPGEPAGLEGAMLGSGQIRVGQQRHFPRPGSA